MRWTWPAARKPSFASIGANSPSSHHRSSERPAVANERDVRRLISDVRARVRQRPGLTGLYVNAPVTIIKPVMRAVSTGMTVRAKRSDVAEAS